MTLLTEFKSFVRGSASTCPDKIIIDALRESAIEFCKRTRLVSDTISVDTVVDQEGYALANDDGFVFSEVELVKDADGLELREYSIPEYRETDNDEADKGFVYVGDLLLIKPLPTAIEALSVRGVIRPADDDDDAPDELYKNWRREIAAGAKFIIFTDYEQYSDPAKAALNRDIFNDGIAMASIKRSKGGSNRRLRTTSRFY